MTTDIITDLQATTSASVMQRRKLGSQGCEVSTLGLGCMGMSEGYGQPDAQAAQHTLQMAVDAGINFFDTAPYYGYGDNEKLLAATFQRTRDQLVIASKCGVQRDARVRDVYHIDHSPQKIQASIDQSLTRLKAEAIDLLYLQGYDPKLPIEEPMLVLAQAVKAGKVRYVGLSEPAAADIRIAHALHSLTALQMEYSLWACTPHHGQTISLCRAEGIGIVATAPLGRGYLTGKIQSTRELTKGDCRLDMPQFQDAALQANRHLLDALKQVANHNGCSLAQCALAWVLAQGEDIIPIPGTKQPRFLQENIETVETVHLKQDDVSTLNKIAQAYAQQLTDSQLEADHEAL